MAEQRNVQHITLKVGTRQFPMNVAPADEYFYREAEKLINERLRFYADRFPALDNETYLFMSLLDIGVRHQRLQAEAEAQPLLKALEGMLADIEQALPPEE